MDLPPLRPRAHAVCPAPREKTLSAYDGNCPKDKLTWEHRHFAGKRKPQRQCARFSANSAHAACFALIHACHRHNGAFRMLNFEI